MPSLRQLPMSRLLLTLLSRSPDRQVGLRRALGRTLVVLCYHDLREPDDVDSWLRVEAGQFREHLRVLHACGTIVGTTSLWADGDSRSGPRFLLTFDDGYPNWLRLGVPILEEFGVPALFFASTHHVLSGEPFWFDRIILPIQSGRVSRLDLTRFGLGTYRFSDGPPERRWEGIQRLLVDVKRVWTGRDLRPVLEHLASSASLVWDRARPLSATELTAMAARGGTCHIGSHAHRHEILTGADPRTVLGDLAESRQQLEELTGVGVYDLAYPNGNVDETVVAAARQAGFERGFTTEARSIRLPATALYRLPRLLVGGYDSAHRLGDRLGGILLRALLRPGRGAS